MKKHTQEQLNSRRDFLRQSACASLGVTGLVNALAQMKLMTSALAQGGLSGDPYKAMVCLFMQGGNDSNNMIVPMGDSSSDEMRMDYETNRGILALDQANLHPIILPNTTAFQKHYSTTTTPSLGFHPSAPKLATLFNSGDLGVVCNVGTLAHPLPTRTDYTDNIIPRPTQLFSHSNQTTQWQSALSDQSFKTGWGGRVAELINAAQNPSSNVAMNISLAGINSFQVGPAGGIAQYVVGSNGAIPLRGFSSGSTSGGDYLPYGNAYMNKSDASGGYKKSNQGHQMKAFDSIMNLANDHLLEDHYTQVIRGARENERHIGAATLGSASLTMDDPDNPGTEINIFDHHFKNADSKLGDQLKMIARLIAGRTHLGNNRQVFFCEIRGFDTHQNMLASHANLMEELSNAMEAFRNCLKDPLMNIFDKVTTFTASDFNRTITPNGTSRSAGSDHAWGGHTLVMGGAVNGGDLYGHFPALKTGTATGSIDSHSTRGRLIPDTSVDQYSYVLADWMGVDSNSKDLIFPNLNRFDNPLNVASTNLGFL